jgi:hypothetical protein
LNTYSLFGLTLASDFPFANRLAAGSGAPDLIFERLAQAPLAPDWVQTAPVWRSPSTANGQSAFSLYQIDRCTVLSFTGQMDFYLWPKRIACQLHDPRLEFQVEINFLGTVLSFWLEQRGIPALHAAAVSVNGQAAAFLSGNRGGKSSLAAAFLQAGYSLLTDDILPIEPRPGNFWGRPGYPQMRLWPEEAQHFVGDYESLPRVHPALDKRRVPVGAGGFGRFCNQSQPLAALYLPQRRAPGEGNGITITPLTPRDAAVELLRRSFSPFLVEAIGLAPRRLEIFARLVQQVPMRRLAYPGGFEHLPAVREAVLVDLQAQRERRENSS